MTQKVKARTICGIYLIRCSANRKWYVGRSLNILKRWSAHRRMLTRGAHDNCYLQAAWNLYGGNSFYFSVHEELPAECLDDAERRYILELGTLAPHGFNLTEGGENGRQSEDSLRRQRESTRLARIAKHEKLRADLGVPEGHKKCSRCARVLPLSEFRVARRSLDGRHSYCRGCSARYAHPHPTTPAQRHAAKRKSEGIPDGHKKCAKCGEIKEMSMFTPSRRALDGRFSYCRPCHNAYLKARKLLKKEEA